MSACICWRLVRDPDYEYGTRHQSNCPRYIPPPTTPRPHLPREYPDNQGLTL